MRMPFLNRPSTTLLLKTIGVLVKVLVFLPTNNSNFFDMLVVMLYMTFLVENPREKLVLAMAKKLILIMVKIGIMYHLLLIHTISKHLYKQIKHIKKELQQEKVDNK